MGVALKESVGKPLVCRTEIANKAYIADKVAQQDGARMLPTETAVGIARQADDGKGNTPRAWRSHG